MAVSVGGQIDPILRFKIWSVRAVSKHGCVWRRVFRRVEEHITDLAAYRDAILCEQKHLYVYSDQTNGNGTAFI